MRYVQVPAPAKHDESQDQEWPVEHPQRGREGQPGRRSTDQPEQAGDHSAERESASQTAET